jgi:sec-independent protein translocase protein TatA
MGDFAKGIKSFKKNMAEDDDASMASDKPAATLSPPGQEVPGSTTVRPTTTVHTQS